jgi:ABC-type antimicrobial peptide transport system permease subunit
LVETVFAWPGLGNLFISSIGNRDYPVLQGIFLFTAVTVVVANVVTDILYGLSRSARWVSHRAHVSSGRALSRSVPT